MVDSNLPLPVLAVCPDPTGVRSQASSVYDPGVPVLAVCPVPTGVRSQASRVFDPGVPALAAKPTRRVAR